MPWRPALSALTRLATTVFTVAATSSDPSSCRVSLFSLSADHTCQGPADAHRLLLYRLGTGLQPGHPSHLRPHLLGRSGDGPIQRQGDAGDLPCSVRIRRPHPLLATVPPYLQDPRRRHARRRRQASPEHVGLRRSLVPPPHVALLGSPVRDRRRLVRQRRLVSQNFVRFI